MGKPPDIPGSEKVPVLDNHSFQHPLATRDVALETVFTGLLGTGRKKVRFKRNCQNMYFPDISIITDHLRPETALILDWPRCVYSIQEDCTSLS